MKNLKYCCQKFEVYNNTPNMISPNIRIVKYISDYLINDSSYKKKFNSSYRFYITFGYEKFEIDLKSLFIEYCPFCGKDLYKFYNKDEYANEIEGKTFTL